MTPSGIGGSVGGGMDLIFHDVMVRKKEKTCVYKYLRRDGRVPQKESRVNTAWDERDGSGCRPVPLPDQTGYVESSRRREIFSANTKILL